MAMVVATGVDWAADANIMSKRERAADVCPGPEIDEGIACAMAWLGWLVGPPLMNRSRIEFPEVVRGC